MPRPRTPAGRGDPHRVRGGPPVGPRREAERVPRPMRPPRSSQPPMRPRLGIFAWIHAVPGSERPGERWPMIPGRAGGPAGGEGAGSRATCRFGDTSAMDTSFSGTAVRGAFPGSVGEQTLREISKVGSGGACRVAGLSCSGWFAHPAPQCAARGWAREQRPRRRRSVEPFTGRRGRGPSLVVRSWVRRHLASAGTWPSSGKGVQLRRIADRRSD